MLFVTKSIEKKRGFELFGIIKTSIELYIWTFSCRVNRIKIVTDDVLPMPGMANPWHA